MKLSKPFLKGKEIVIRPELQRLLLAYLLHPANLQLEKFQV